MSRSNKKSSGSSAGGFSPWHPNFRNAAELPDTKTVRTKFFVNAACVVLGLGALLYLLSTEYTIRSAKQELRGVEEQIARNSKPSQDAIAHYKKFKESEAKITDLSTFLANQKVLFSDFAIEVGQSLPEHVAITNIQLRDADVSLKGVVKSAPELASSIASAYEKQLRDTADLAQRFPSISLTTLSRDSATGFLNFEIILKFKP